MGRKDIAVYRIGKKVKNVANNLSKDLKDSMKLLIRHLANRFGYDIVRTTHSDLSLYNNYSRDSLRDRRFYNIGAGDFEHPYWTNIDYATEHYKNDQQQPFLSYNLMELKPLPIESNSAEIIYSSHTIEHINDDAARNMLKESHRVLKRSGVIRLTTPDALLEFMAYKNGDMSFWYWIDWFSQPGNWEKLYKMPLREASIHQLFLHHFASQLCEIDIDDSPTRKYSDIDIIEIFAEKPYVQTLDYFTTQCKFNSDHPGNHINWWTQDKLFSFLKEAGFSEYYRSGWGQSCLPPLRETKFFDNTHPKISLYVEAIKT